MSGLIDLGRKQSELFIKNNLAYCELLVIGTSNRHIMEMVYHVLVGHKKIKALEELPQEDKAMSWETANDFAKGRMDKEGVVELVKCLHALEYYL